MHRTRYVLVAGQAGADEQTVVWLQTNGGFRYMYIVHSTIRPFSPLTKHTHIICDIAPDFGGD